MYFPFLSRNWCIIHACIEDLIDVLNNLLLSLRVALNVLCKFELRKTHCNSHTCEPGGCQFSLE